ncbi:MAG TPA: hemolysin III family protein [Pyrinomonadaceae bacterium]|nr:hemolysin III family protein [Pyrinomonadaceae bacterium]
MDESVAPCTRPQSLGEEIANSITHGVGLLLALCVVPFLVAGAVRRGDAANVVGASVFGATLVMLYLASTVYHALPRNRAKSIFQILDHAAIYLLIAGTYTPFTLGVLRGAWGWTLLALIWAMAIFGVVLKAVSGTKCRRLSMCLYLAMGWLVLIAVRPVLSSVPASGLVWIAAGGVAYTSGVAFFAAERMRYSHSVWHLFVLAGSVCHVFAVLWYAA